MDNDWISLVGDEQEMKVVKLAVRLRKEGRSYQRISDELTIQRLKNKSGNVRWSTTQVYRMINY